MHQHSIPNKQGGLKNTAWANPAAGAVNTLTVPDKVRWRIIGLRVTLVTDATAATRQVFFRVIAGALDLFRIYAQVTQTATLTREYTFTSGGPDRSAVAGTEIITALPPDLLVNDTHDLNLGADNYQAGDDFGPAIMLTEEWIEN